MGEIAGNIIATIPTVQLAVNNEIVIGSYVIIAFIISGWSFDTTQASAEVETNERRIIVCSLCILVISQVYYKCKKVFLLITALWILPQSSFAKKGLKTSRSKYLSALAGCRDICIETITDIEDNKESDNKPAKKAISITKSNRQKNFISDAFTEDERRFIYNNLINHYL
jgi:hypothetical protein